MKSSEVKVLVVEDDKGVREVLVELFKASGFSVSQADGGDKAWSMLDQEPIDLVLTDIRMRNGDGIELLKKIKNKNLMSPTVLLISGYADQSVEQILDLGAEGFFRKPFNSGEVRDAVRKSFLPLGERWSVPLSQAISQNITHTVPTLSGANAEGNVAIGRGGFFFGGKFGDTGSSNFVNFTITVTDGTPVKEISGIGSVAWVRDSKSGKPAGIGVEIRYLADSCRTEYSKWITQQKIRPYIPAE